MKLIIIQGAPCTGKTTLTKRLAKDLGCDFFSKDGYKEKRFDEIGGIPNLKEWAKAEFEAKDKLIETVKSKHSDKQFVIESNFRKKDRDALSLVLKDKDEVYEIFCYVQGLTSLKRYRTRIKQGEWHKGHRAVPLGYPIVANISVMNALGYRLHKPLRFSDHTLEVDMTDFAKVSYDKILDFVR